MTASWTIWICMMEVFFSPMIISQTVYKSTRQWHQNAMYELSETLGAQSIGLPSALPSVQALLGHQLPTSSSRFHQWVGGHTDIIGALCPYPQLLPFLACQPSFHLSLTSFLGWRLSLMARDTHPCRWQPASRKTFMLPPYPHQNLPLINDSGDLW